MNHSQFEREQVEKKISKANELINIADNLIFSYKEQEKLYRKALSILRSAYNWSCRDKKLLFELHRVGKIIKKRFGCKYTFKENQYIRDCPVELAHIPFGFSIGGEAKKICSICLKDPLDCEHIKGNYYDSVICKKNNSLCNICLKEKCIHIEGESYDRVRAVNIIQEIKLDHVSIVSNPADPDAVFTEIPIDRKTIFQRLGPHIIHFKWGQPLICNHCIICKGF